MIPFTRQSRHLSQLKRDGYLPQFGSFQYNLQTLAKRGLILGMTNISPKLYDQFILTINSREIGVFMIEIQEAESKSIPKRVEIYLEKLLDAQAVRSFLSFFFVTMAHQKHEIHNTGWQGLLSYR